MEVEGGRGRHRGIWLCAPPGLAPSSSCPRPRGWGSPRPHQGQGDGAKRSAEGARVEAAGGGSTLPHLPTSLREQGHRPRLCWLHGAGPSTSGRPPGTAPGAAAWTARTVGPGTEGARLCVRAGQARPQCAMSLPRSGAEAALPEAHEEGKGQEDWRRQAPRRPHVQSGPRTPACGQGSTGHHVTAAGERPRKGQCGPTGGTAWGPEAETAAPGLASPADRVFTSAGGQAPRRQQCPGRLGRAGGGDRGGRSLALAPCVPFWILNHMNVLPSQKNK